jgi:hypothetical protein
MDSKIILRETCPELAEGEMFLPQRNSRGGQRGDKRQRIEKKRPFTNPFANECFVSIRPCRAGLLLKATPLIPGRSLPYSVPSSECNERVVKLPDVGKNDSAVNDSAKSSLTLFASLSICIKIPAG